MALKGGVVGSEPIRMYKTTPTAVASNIIFLAAWLAGTTGYFLSILATTFAQCIRWLPLGLESSPLWSQNAAERTFRPPRPKPVVARPLLSRENVERHVSFSLDTRTCHEMQESLPSSSEAMTCTTASFSSDDSMLCSSPLSDLGDLPPLKNLPPLLLDPQVSEQNPVKKRPTTPNFPLKTRNPFKFRRTSTSSAPSPTPMISEVLPACPSIDQSPASPTEKNSRKPSLIRRLNMKGRRSTSANAMTNSPSSAPASPRPSPLSFRNPGMTSKRSASVDIPTRISDSPAFVPPSPQQGSPRRIFFGSLTRRPRTTSLSAAPARTQPYGPPYNCPLPIPQPRRSSGTRRPTTSTRTSIPAASLA